MVLVATEPCTAADAELPPAEASSFFSFGSLPRLPALQCLLREKSRAFLLISTFMWLLFKLASMHLYFTGLCLSTKKITTSKFREANLALLYKVKF